jgi:hypothetical protein
MYNGKTLSLSSIVWKVMKNPMASDLSYEEAAEFSLEFIRLIGAPLVFSDIISKPIELNMYKAKVPDNLLYVKGIKYICGDCDDNSFDTAIALTHATDIYHSGSMPNGVVSQFQGYTYVIDKGIVKTSLEDGYIVISYKGLAVDENGYPLIPDDEPFKIGLEYYILHRYLEPMYLMGKITDKAFGYIEQKRHFYTARANNSLQMPDVDHMESIMNGLNRIIINDTAQKNFFRTYGSKENTKPFK